MSRGYSPCHICYTLSQVHMARLEDNMSVNLCQIYIQPRLPQLNFSIYGTSGWAVSRRWLCPDGKSSSWLMLRMQQGGTALEVTMGLIWPYVSDHIRVPFWKKKKKAKSWESKCLHTETVSFFDFARYLLQKTNADNSQDIQCIFVAVVSFSLCNLQSAVVFGTGLCCSIAWVKNLSKSKWAYRRRFPLQRARTTNYRLQLLTCKLLSFDGHPF